MKKSTFNRLLSIFLMVMAVIFGVNGQVIMAEAALPDGGTTEGGHVPVIRPFQERRMRSAAKSGNQSAFLASFGRPDEPFPTLLAKAVNMISFWYEGEEKDGVLRNLTPVECERLMGLPEGWTAYGNLGQPISDNARCKALGNAIALPCADYIMAGIAETIHE